jgi:NADPH:quinone reductase-like Zn-dependent oxidoreductase
VKAVVLKVLGGPPPIPRVEPGTFLIRAVAASVNPADVSIISPIRPAILGSDVAGVAEAVGDRVTDFAPGSLLRLIDRHVMSVGEALVE